MLRLGNFYYLSEVQSFLEIPLMNHFKTIAIFQYPAQYAVLRLLFDQEEIRYIFQNETTVSIFPFYTNASGGIRLQVHLEDMERAMEIMNDLNHPSNLKIV